MKKYKGFVLSYNFIPYINSASIDFYKKIKYMKNVELDVLYVPVGKKDERFFEFTCDTKINYIEIPLKHNPNETGILNSAKIMFLWLFQSIKYYIKNREKYDFIMSHAFSMLSHLSAIFINFFSKKKWIAYFSDPVKGNPYFEKDYIPIGKLYKVYLWIEKRTMRKSDQVIFNNFYQKKLAKINYGEDIEKKSSIIEHCFDEIMYPKNEERTHFFNDNKFHIVHVGTMFPPKRVGALVIEAIDEYIDEIGLENNNLILDFIGPECEYDLDAQKKMKYPDSVRFHGSVDYFESLQIMTEADVLLLIDADFSTDGIPFSPFLPGKYSEYIGAKKPIMAVTMAEGAVANKQTEFSYPILEWDKTQIKDYLKNVENMKIADNYNEIRNKMSAKIQSNRLYRIIETCIGR